MAPQIYSWTCSSCSLDWVLESTGCRGSDRERTVYEIGYPDQINATYGLMDGSGAQLQRVLGDYGLGSEQGWLDFDAVYELAQETTGMMSGQQWYHWVSIRGVQGPNLWIANSACGYRGVWETLSRQQFNDLGGFSVVWLV